MLGFLGQFKSAVKQPGEETTEKPPEMLKSTSADEFFKSAGTKNFINNWTGKGEPNYTKRGVTQLLRELFPRYESDKAVMKAADNVLKMLRGEDSLTGFLAGMKAKSEGLMKGLKSVLGGKG